MANKKEDKPLLDNGKMSSKKDKALADAYARAMSGANIGMMKKGKKKK